MPSWTDFIQGIRDARSDLGATAPVWYRGQAKAYHKLRPSLLRRQQGIDKEKDIFNEYELNAAYLQGKKDNDWDLLSDMQHYGIPTRLLDWTDVLGIAVAFALYDNNDNKDDSVVYVLNPILLNNLSGVGGIKRASGDPDFGYKKVYWHGQPFSPNYPIAVDAIFHNTRLRAQRGGFTVHGRSTEPLDDQAPNAVRCVVIPAAVKPEAREFLEHANLNAFSIYPDIVGMAQHIVRKYLP